jgi:hypothetical protein
MFSDWLKPHIFWNARRVLLHIVVVNFRDLSSSDWLIPQTSHYLITFDRNSKRVLLHIVLKFINLQALSGYEANIGDSQSILP